MRKKAPERQCIKNRTRMTSGLILVIAIGIGVVAAACAIAIVGANYTVSRIEDSANVALQVNLYGNDIIVDIVSGGNEENLQFLYLIIDGYDLPESFATRTVTKGVVKVVYPSVAVGISGIHQVGIRGVFKDGSTMLLAHKEIRFS